MSRYWQHESPLACPHGHEMIWLGGRFWICGRSGCNQIYVELAEPGEPQSSSVGDIKTAVAAGEN